jgi:F0F1-type ATP synthase membrane subunit a
MLQKKSKRLLENILADELVVVVLISLASLIVSTIVYL